MRPLLDKEAESSSRLEGTQASIEDVYKAEVISNPDIKDDVSEIVNYQEAIKDRPLNKTLIRQIHKTLMDGVRGQDKGPGKFRTEDVWIGQDGTGRTGRALITLYLLKSGTLYKPMLHSSGYFEKSKDGYIDALHGVDTKEDWQT